MTKNFKNDRSFSVTIPVANGDKITAINLEIYVYNKKVLLSVCELEGDFCCSTLSDKNRYYIIDDMPRFSKKKFENIINTFTDDDFIKYTQKFIEANNKSYILVA